MSPLLSAAIVESGGGWGCQPTEETPGRAAAECLKSPRCLGSRGGRDVKDGVSPATLNIQEVIFMLFALCFSTSLSTG